MFSCLFNILFALCANAMVITMYVCMYVYTYVRMCVYVLNENKTQSTNYRDNSNLQNLTKLITFRF